MLYTFIVNALYAIIVVLCSVFVFLFCKWLPGFIAMFRRKQDKEMVRRAMLEEAYYNDLYEEILYEEADQNARKTARQMQRIRHH